MKDKKLHKAINKLLNTIKVIKFDLENQDAKTIDIEKDTYRNEITDFLEKFKVLTSKDLTSDKKGNEASDNLCCQNSSKIKELNDLRNKINDKDNNILRLTQNLNNSEEEKQKLHANIQNLNREKSNCEQQILSLNQENSVLGQNITNLKNCIDNLNDKFSKEKEDFNNKLLKDQQELKNIECFINNIPNCMRETFSRFYCLESVPKFLMQIGNYEKLENCWSFLNQSQCRKFDLYNNTDNLFNIMKSLFELHRQSYKDSEKDSIELLIPSIGEKYNPEKHKREGSDGDYIDIVAMPGLLRDGNIIRKALVILR